MALELEGTQQTESNQDLEVEKRDLRKLFLLSFQYSQGVSSIQHDLHRWNLLNGFLKSVELPKQAPYYLNDITPPSLHMKINLNSYISQKTLYQGSIQHEWALFRKILSEEDKNTINKELLVENITREMIKRDLAFQYRDRPERSLDTNYAPDSSQDPHKSFIRKHALMKVPTGHPSYDILFSEIGEVINAYEINDKESATLKPIVLPSGSEVRDGIINRFDLPQALEHLASAWNRQHAKSGETFFETS